MILKRILSIALGLTLGLGALWAQETPKPSGLSEDELKKANDRLTPNPDVIYVNPLYDIRQGPVVLEIRLRKNSTTLQQARGRWCLIFFILHDKV